MLATPRLVVATLATDLSSAAICATGSPTGMRRSFTSACGTSSRPDFERSTSSQRR